MASNLPPESVSRGRGLSRRRFGALSAAALSTALAGGMPAVVRAAAGGQTKAASSSSASALGGAEPALVYHAKDVTPENFTALFDLLTRERGLASAGRTGIKLHGDEVDLNRPLWQALKAHVKESRYIEGNWASTYTSGRGNTEGNYRAIMAQGVPREEIDILDGAGDYRLLPVAGEDDIKEVAVGRSLLENYDTVAVTANFKIPSFAGYSGAMKNVGIGLAGAPGKTAVHGEGFAKDADFYRRLAAASEAICRALEGKLVFINVVTDLKAEPLEGAQLKTGTLGIFASTSMGAVDQAVLDALYGLSPAQYDAFDEDVKVSRGFLQLEYLARRNPLARAYRLTEV